MIGQVTKERTIVEWGVRFTSPFGWHITECDSEAEARRIAKWPKAKDCSSSAVNRRVIVGEWVDR